MKAVVYLGPKNIRVEDVAMPAIAEDEILVRVKASGICGTDLHMYRLGMFEALGKPIGNGRIMGHELSGEVVETGNLVTGFRQGDRITGVGVGAFAEYVSIKVTETGPYLLPENIGYAEGATLEPLATSLQGIRLAGLTDTETVVILGAGIIGLGCLQIIRTTLSCRVIVIDASPRRLDLAKQLGADAVVNMKTTDPVVAVIELTGGAKPVPRFGIRGGNADAVIDCAGARLSPTQGLRMLKQADGRLVLVALFEQEPELDFNQVVRRQVNILGSWAWTRNDYLQAIDLVRSKRVDRKPLTSHEFPLDKALQAFELQSNPENAIKVLLIP